MKFSSLLAIEFADLVKAQMSQIQSESSGLLVESTLQLIPDEIFECIRGFMDAETAEQQVPIVEFLHELVSYIALREHRVLTLDVYMIAISNLWLMFTFEGLRRMGVLQYQTIPDIFKEDNGRAKLTPTGQLMNDECREMRVM